MAKTILLFATFITATAAASTCSAAEVVENAPPAAAPHEVAARPLELRLQRERRERLEAARVWKFNRPNTSRSLTGRESLRWMDARPIEDQTQNTRWEFSDK